ncbi:hypothetical protein DNU06_15920 [Putridiphycobacter roseus]|uniref:AttH domain-containing protein n=1 Tax=Putridiphycobacter roseus TaxID=2219161 RepID=A0A2W1MVM0_9FLAO|nr:hypothetical protein [Putridiphycobacter roseus]PZE15867.1 hypothetical protein DNU06_15920 [Putridiphycobacter roseus]
MKAALKTLLSSALLLLLSQSTFGQTVQTNLAKVSNDFEKYHLVEGNVPEKWEDGMRSSGEKGTYEWWYFDSHLADGSTVVIVFYTKFMTSVNKALEPYATISIDKADGSKIEKSVYCKPEDFFAAKDSCHVKIGKSYIVGNLKNYEIHFENEEINFTAQIDRTTESWRPKTGHMVFGEAEDKEFNWVVSVPQGKINASYKYQNETVNTSGSCYHDHNWGNISMVKLFNHWYWSRAQIGPYNVIASEMIADKAFNNDNIIVFNISKDGKTIADNGEQVKLYGTYGKMHPTLNKDISDHLIFIYDNPEDEYRYEYYLFKEKTIVEADLLEAAVGKGLKYGMAKLFTDIEPAYFRFTGKAEIKVYKADQLIEKYASSNAVWELMYFGNPLEQK